MSDIASTLVTFTFFSENNLSNQISMEKSDREQQEYHRLRPSKTATLQARFGQRQCVGEVTLPLSQHSQTVAPLNVPPNIQSTN